MCVLCVYMRVCVYPCERRREHRRVRACVTRVCDDSDVDNSSVVFPTSGALERRLSWDGAAEDDAREARRRREVRRCSYLWG